MALNLEFKDKEESEKQISLGEISKKEYFYQIKKIKEIKETQGIICGIRNLGIVRKIKFSFLDGNGQSPDEVMREGSCHIRKKCYLVATNMKYLVYVLCTDAEVIDE